MAKKAAGGRGATNVVVAAGYCVCVRAVGGGRQLTISQDACFLLFCTIILVVCCNAVANHLIAQSSLRAREDRKDATIIAHSK